MNRRRFFQACGASSVVALLMGAGGFRGTPLVAPPAVVGVDVGAGLSRGYTSWATVQPFAWADVIKVGVS